MNKIHLKYVDDLTLAERINFKTQVDVSPLDERPQPDNLRDRTGHKLINGQSQVLKQLNETKLYADKNNMKLNLCKTKLMVSILAPQKPFCLNLKLMTH